MSGASVQTTVRATVFAIPTGTAIATTNLEEYPVTRGDMVAVLTQIEQIIWVRHPSSLTVESV